MARISLLCPNCLSRRRRNTNHLAIAWHAAERARLWFWCPRCDRPQYIHLQPPTVRTMVDAYDILTVDLYETSLLALPDLHLGLLMWLNPTELRRAVEHELDLIFGTTPRTRVDPPEAP